MHTWINGLAGDSLPSSDRGLLYGDGLFETIAIRDGMPVYLDEHLQRLQAGCQRLQIGGLDMPLLAQEVETAITGCSAGVLKVLITRGSGGRGYRPPHHASPVRMLQLHPCQITHPSSGRRGVVVRQCETTLGKNPALAGLKHLNRLEQVIARNEWSDETVFEGVMCDSDGMLVEATQSNIFWVKNSILYTPDLSFSGVAGIMRQQVLKSAAALNITIRVVREVPAVLNEVDELFITNSLIGVMPVRQYCDYRYRVGVITQQLQKAVEKY